MKSLSMCLLAASAATLSACGVLGGRRLANSPDFAAARGTVKFRAVGVDETGIDLRVKNLAEPDALAAPGYAYVAWVRTSPEEEPRNVGALCLGEHQDGTLRAVTPSRRFEFFVTAEATRDAERPTGERLLWASRD